MKYHDTVGVLEAEGERRTCEQPMSVNVNVNISRGRPGDHVQDDCKEATVDFGGVL